MDFQQDHPILEIKCLKLRSLHFTPVLAAQRHPSWSEFTNKKTGKNFILYCATLLIPWGNKFEDYDLSQNLKKLGQLKIILIRISSLT